MGLLSFSSQIRLSVLKSVLTLFYICVYVCVMPRTLLHVYDYTNIVKVCLVVEDVQEMDRFEESLNGFW